MTKFILMVVVGLFIGGCAHSPTPEQFSSAYYGDYPKNYKETVLKYFSRALIDPSSAQYSDWVGPTKGYYGPGFGEFEFGYLVCVNVNSKNRMGGYAGSSRFLLVLRDDSIAYKDEATGGGVISQNIIQICNRI